MGLISYQGDIQVLGQSPLKNRTKLLKNMSYIADVACLPSWMSVQQLTQFMVSTHPAFNLNECLRLFEKTNIKLNQTIANLSKGMKTRLHLYIILSIDSQLLILDETTLGLDVLVRREFHDGLIDKYFNPNRAILITTYQIDEVEKILARVIFIKEGQIKHDIQINEFKSQYQKLVCSNQVDFSQYHLTPIYSRVLPNNMEYLFKGADKIALSKYGEVVTPSLEDLFVATNSE